MIDYFALALGHGLLVLAFLRLVMRDSLDVDPAISELSEAAEAKRPKTGSNRRISRSSDTRDEGEIEQ